MTAQVRDSIHIEGQKGLLNHSPLNREHLRVIEKTSHHFGHPPERQ